MWGRGGGGGTGHFLEEVRLDLALKNKVGFKWPDGKEKVLGKG